MLSFGFDSFQRYLNQEIIIKKNLTDENFIDPPGIINKTYHNCSLFCFNDIDLVIGTTSTG